MTVVPPLYRDEPNWPHRMSVERCRRDGYAFDLRSAGHRSSTMSCAGRRTALANPEPAHSAIACGSPAFAAAPRITFVRWCRLGYAAGAASSLARMKSLVSPRANRPLKARVIDESENCPLVSASL